MVLTVWERERRREKERESECVCVCVSTCVNVHVCGCVCLQSSYYMDGPVSERKREGKGEKENICA